MRYVFMVLLGGVFVMGGCQFQQEVWLNPDGSGKMDYEAVFVPQPGNDGEPAFAKPVSEVIDNTKGVDAWEDVEATLLDDGRIHFKGTAYFRDLTLVKIPRGPGAEIQWEDVEGGKRLSLANDKPNFDDIDYQIGDDLDTAALRARQAFGQAKHMPYALLRDGRWTLKVHLPAPIDSSSNFKREDDSTVLLDVKGNDMIAALEHIFNDMDAIKRILLASARGNRQVFSNMLNERLLGQAGPVEVTTNGAGKPQFDYAAKVAAANADAISVYRKLDLMADKLPPMPAELADMKVTLKEVRPMAQGAEWMTIELTADAEADIVEEEDGQIFEIIADDGERLAPSFGVLRKVETRGRRGNVELTVYLAPPGDGVKKLSVVRGTFIAVVGGDVKEHELDLKTFAAGENGKVFNARVKEKKIEDTGGDMVTNVTITLDTPHGSVKDVRMVDAAGEKIRVYHSGSGTDQTTLKCRISSNGIPEGAKMLIDVYENAKRLEVPFEARDIDLSSPDAE